MKTRRGRPRRIHSASPSRITQRAAADRGVLRLPSGLSEEMILSAAEAEIDLDEGVRTAFCISCAAQQPRHSGALVPGRCKSCGQRKVFTALEIVIRLAHMP